MTLLLPLLLPFITGYLLTRLCTNALALPALPLFRITLSLPLGFGLASLFLFGSYCLFPAQAQGATLGLMTLSGAILFILQHKGLCLKFSGSWISAVLDFKKTRPFLFFLNFSAALLFAFLLWQYLDYFFAKISWNIFGGWDARYFWNLKAKFYFRDPELWKGMFHPILDWAHPDYPLLLPGSITWGWIVLGKEFLLWPAILDLTFMLSLTLLVLWYLGTQASWFSGFLAASYLLVIPMFRFWSTTQYADLPLGFFFTASVLCLTLFLRLRHPPLLYLAGFLGGLSAWTKNEGIFFLFWFSAILFFYLTRSPAFPLNQKGRLLLRLSLALALPCIAVAYAKIVLGSQGGEYWGSGRTVADYFQLLTGDFRKTQFLGAAFLIFFANFKQWLGLWILFALALIFNSLKPFKRTVWLSASFVFLIELGYFVILHVSPNELKLQIETALLRLMLHSAPLALVFIFESAGNLRYQPGKQAAL